MTHCARLSPPRNSRRGASRRSLRGGSISYESPRCEARSSRHGGTRAERDLALLRVQSRRRAPGCRLSQGTTDERPDADPSHRGGQAEHAEAHGDRGLEVHVVAPEVSLSQATNELRRNPLPYQSVLGTVVVHMPGAYFVVQSSGAP
jgi:hypothetical protein